MRIPVVTLLQGFILYVLTGLVAVLVMVAFYTLAERKTIAAVQRRKGPELVGIWGLLQPFADGLKALLKETLVPSRIYTFFFFFAPWWVFFWSFAGWLAIPTHWSFNIFMDSTFTILILLLFSTLSNLGLLLAGWSSNNKYSFYGAFRSISQLFSYELLLSASLIPIIFFTGGFDFIQVVLSQKYFWNIFFLLPFAGIVYISILAETNRVPFDLPEAEGELVAGYNLEYSGFVFALFFLGEYSSMLLMANFFTLIFLGGWLIPQSVAGFFVPVPFFVWRLLETFFLMLKILLLSMSLVLIRTLAPRYRFDQLLNLGWTELLPLSLGLVFLYINLGFALGLPWESTLVLFENNVLSSHIPGTH